MRSLLLSTALAVILPLGAASAAQITLDNSTGGSIKLTGSGTGDLTISTTALSGAATDGVSTTIGSYVISGFGPVSATGIGSGVWDFSDTATLTYTNPSGNDVTEDLVFASVNDGSVNPHFKGSDTVTSVSGSAAFEAAWALGTRTDFDITMSSITTVLDSLALTTNSVTTGISSGEDVTIVSEPSALAVMGLGVLGIAALHARRRRA